MANRFGEQYRLPHDGQSVWGGMIPNLGHPDTTPYPNTLPFYDLKNGRGEDGYGSSPSGGTKVPRKPKPQSPAGGMNLPLPTKVSL